ncbi:MAG: hypothetical protein GWN14_18835 [candidate division Zixibacteria bacterium]|nr:hypothetical protein [candidate division Zixibacteria bacterium]NIX57920.1 hypothetical protein [candidate division Zixibacteria bacterium]
MLDIEIIDQQKLDEGYSIPDELVGYCESERRDASENHDAIIYGIESKK